MVTVGDLMRECRNYFDCGFIEGTFSISDNGELAPNDGITPNRYIAIQGSALNDGVYLYDSDRVIHPETDDSEINAETFNGKIWLLSPPSAFVRLASEISEFADKNPAGGMKAESFGEYSYTKSSGKNGAALTWQDAYASALRPYKRLLTHVGV